MLGLFFYGGGYRPLNLLFWKFSSFFLLLLLLLLFFISGNDGLMALLLSSTLYIYFSSTLFKSLFCFIMLGSHSTLLTLSCKVTLYGNIGRERGGKEGGYITI